MTELKPCPFCKSNDVEVHRYGEYIRIRSYYVFCNFCESSSGAYKSLPDAVALWNQRSTPSLDGLYEAADVAMDEHPLKDEEAFSGCWELDRGAIQWIVGRAAEIWLGIKKEKNA